MKKFVPFFVFLILLSVALFATGSYREARAGERLYARYFEAEPAMGYGTARGLAAGATTGELATLEQGKRYHQAEEYGLALASLRAYLEHNPLPENYVAELLAGTAAMASGEYGEAKRHLRALPAEIPEADGAALWYLSLLDLREENLAAARGKLQVLANSPGGRLYPAREVLDNLLAK